MQPLQMPQLAPLANPWADADEEENTEANGNANITVTSPGGTSVY